ncbi:hypothetical protein ScPMuIL_012985 [Solemya velum]
MTGRRTLNDSCEHTSIVKRSRLKMATVAVDAPAVTRLGHNDSRSVPWMMLRSQKRVLMAPLEYKSRLPLLKVFVTPLPRNQYLILTTTLAPRTWH